MPRNRIRFEIRPFLLLALAASVHAAATRPAIEPISDARSISDTLSAALNTDRSIIYFSAGESLSNWTVVRLPTGAHATELVGGEGESVLVRTVQETDDQGDPSLPIGSIQSVSFDGSLTEIASKVGAPCDFASRQVGCQVKAGKALVTVNGGASWKPVPITATALSSTITELKWLSVGELVVGRSDGRVSLFTVRGDEIKERWDVNVVRPARHLALCGGDGIWLWADTVLLLSRRDGHVIAKAKSDGVEYVAGLTGDEKHACVWGSKEVAKDAKKRGLEVASAAGTQPLLDSWDWNGEALAHGQSPQPANGIGAVVIKNGKTAVIFQNGEISLLEGQKLVAQPVTVSAVGRPPRVTDVVPPVNVVPPPPAGAMPSPQEVAEEQALAAKTPILDVIKVQTELNDHQNFTDRQRILYMRDRFKELANARQSSN